jgi:hypothetical protein
MPCKVSVSYIYNMLICTLPFQKIDVLSVFIIAILCSIVYNTCASVEKYRWLFIVTTFSNRKWREGQWNTPKDIRYNERSTWAGKVVGCGSVRESSWTCPRWSSHWGQEAFLWPRCSWRKGVIVVASLFIKMQELFARSLLSYLWCKLVGGGEASGFILHCTWHSWQKKTEECYYS